MTVWWLIGYIYLYCTIGHRSYLFLACAGSRLGQSCFLHSDRAIFACRDAEAYPAGRTFVSSLDGAQKSRPVGRLAMTLAPGVLETSPNCGAESPPDLTLIALWHQMRPHVISFSGISMMMLRGILVATHAGGCQTREHIRGRRTRLVRW
jgi:hypothetical protein